MFLDAIRTGTDVSQLVRASQASRLTQAFRNNSIGSGLKPRKQSLFGQYYFLGIVPICFLGLKKQD